MEKSRKLKRQELKRLVEKSIIRDEEKKRIKWSATASTQEVLRTLNTSLNGLDPMQISRSRMLYGKNQTTSEKKKSLIQLILESLDQPTCYVVRKNENLINILSKEIVVGDIVHLSEGDVVPADLRIIEADGLKVDQNVISKDKTPVKKTAEICCKEAENVADYSNILLMGTLVVSGYATAVVLSVGDHAIMGTIS